MDPNFLERVGALAGMQGRMRERLNGGRMRACVGVAPAAEGQRCKEGSGGARMEVKKINKRILSFKTDAGKRA